MSKRSVYVLGYLALAMLDMLEQDGYSADKVDQTQYLPTLLY